MKITFWTYPMSGGDGSASVMIFRTEAEAQAFRKREEDEYGEGWAEDCVSEETIEVNEDGELTKGYDTEASYFDN